MGLSIDGGGTKGVVPSTFVDFLSSELKKPPHQIFD
jgi:hypothetical protein